MKALIVEEFGDSSKLKYSEVPKPEPVEGEVLVKNEICGLNYLEVMIRDGYLPLEALGSGFPLTMGVEAAGVVEKVGANVSGVTKGERVAYAVVGSGAHAEYAKVSASRLVKVPDEVSFEQAATSMIQGLTAHYLVHTTGRVKAGDKVLIHAISGGTGSLVCQVAKNAGAFVIGTTSTEAKAAKAREAGADEVILYSQRDFAEEVNRITDGKGVNVIYDGIGKKTFEKDFECLAIQGIVVSFGLVSGPPPPIDVEKLAKGSFSICRPMLFHYIANKEDLEWRSSEVFNWIKTNKVKFGDFTVLPLSEGKKAYELLGSGKSTGKILMKP
ncbi:Quinone oxidoreductase 1 [Stylophora pistillata]|uniref:Probable quinone oxidoreductase n=2 Tax=Stylophora pistillata TaxID=50429 RepID=A0A2B4SPU0_STYPI|nr:Quinone oxidoreductase 1 [Stylophora pistillata]